MASRGGAGPNAFIDFDIIGDEMGVQKMLNRIDSSLSPIGLTAFLGLAVGPWVKERAQDRFAAEGDDVSGKWAALSPATIHWREAGGYPGEHPINKRTGELEAYITQSDIDVHVVPGLGVMKYPGDNPTKTSIREKMKTAQKGRGKPQTKPRPVLGLNERDLAQIMTMLAFHVKGTGVTRGVADR